MYGYIIGYILVLFIHCELVDVNTMMVFLLFWLYELKIAGDMNRYENMLILPNDNFIIFKHFLSHENLQQQKRWLLPFTEDIVKFLLHLPRTPET